MLGIIFDPPGACVGMEVLKYFEEDDTIHVGHVKETDVDEKNNLPMFLVEFDDGDQEDMHWSELRPLLHVATVHPDSEDDEVCLPTHVHVCTCMCVWCVCLCVCVISPCRFQL